MKSKWGALMVDGRGKLGGHVATKNRQGSALRTKVSPIQRRSNSQQLIKSRFTNLSQDWRDLTADQRAAWNAAAPDYIFTNIFGDNYSPTGKNLFMLVNQNILLGGGTQISTPILPVSPDALTAFGIGSNTSAAQTLTFAPSPVAADNAVIIEATRPLSPGKDVGGSAFRIITTLAAAATSAANTFAAYQAVFGTPITGKKIFFRATPVEITSGVRGIPLQVSGITA